MTQEFERWSITTPEYTELSATGMTDDGITRLAWGRRQPSRLLLSS